jgi:zinc metalloprotease ZmpB
MKTRFEEGLRAQLTVDDLEQVHQINHFEQLWEPGEGETAGTPREAAEAYVRSMAGVLGVPEERLAGMQESVSYVAPRKQDVQYRLAEEKTLFDSTTFGFVQTVNNVPVWNSGLTVTVKHGPNRVVSATNNSHPNPIPRHFPKTGPVARHQGLMHTADNERAIRKNARLLRRASAGSELVAEAATVPLDAESQTASFVRELVGRPAARRRTGIAESAAPKDNARVVRGRFFIYQYDPEERLPKLDNFVEAQPETGSAPPVPPLPFDLKPVPASIQAGEYYLVNEMTFKYDDPTFGDLTWQALVEIESDAVLYLRPLAAGVNGLIFRVDPITASGDASKTSASSNAVLNPFRSSAVLPNLNGPVGGTQSLIGSRVAITEEESPNVVAPTRPSGTSFDFPVRTNDFAAVNAYYHSNVVFSTIESLGFPLATYFNGTSFPVEVDHRGMGTAINAHCVGNGTGGIDHCCYALNDTTDTVNPVGRACDSRVHWHELGGHGILYEHVNSPNFGFAHSAGDGLSAIFHDPGSKAPDRFRYAPWNPINLRRFDRDPAAGWGWGGVQDVGGYPSEEILATTHFRIYRSIGGDAASLATKRFASRMTMYLILRAISTLTPGTNPGNALGLCNAEMAVDLLNWTSEGIFGGAYNKVIRWAYEKQGLFGGKPPAVDVYIDDGRKGEYQYQPVHWNTTTIWNRNKADGLAGHQAPILGQTNFVYVRIRNRGTQTASDVRVKGFHCKPGAGLLWPNDLQPMTTPEIVVGTLGANSSQEKVVGPFKWTPITNAFGHDCIMMIASASGDPSNVSQFTAGETIPEWRLVPNDNNIGQRNVQPVAGGGGMEGLKATLNGLTFSAANPNKKTAQMQVRAIVPPVLASRGWKVTFAGLPDGNKFMLASGAKRDIKIAVTPGKQFTASNVKSARIRHVNIELLADDIVVGGMTYPIDPDKKK